MSLHLIPGLGHPRQRTNPGPLPFLFFALASLYMFASPDPVWARGKKPPREDVERSTNAARMDAELDENPVDDAVVLSGDIPSGSVEIPSAPDEPSETPQSSESAKPPAEAGSAQSEAPASGGQLRGSTYTVWVWQETRDCLWRLAKQHYRDPWKWKKIYLANRAQILDPNVIFPKQRIFVPELDQ